MDEAPEAEKREVGVGERAKMSVGWALSTVWVVRYCFDCQAQRLVYRYINMRALGF
jgi:hypothetical protein